MPIKLDSVIEAMTDDLIAIRRELHRCPELGFEEFRTSEIVANKLEELGLEVRRQVAKTGILATWKGTNFKENAPSVAFRADMDALALEELNAHDFKSENPGKMHACGHDGHMAILLGFARWLVETKPDFPGAVRLIFQPAEEGLGGAEPMIQEGALRDPDISQVFGLHIWNYMEYGLINAPAGPMMASADSFRIIVRGKGGHAAIPHQAVDAVVVGAQIVTALQTLVSRRIDPLEPAVITVAQFNAGSAHNIIAESAELIGSARAFDFGVRENLPKMIEETADGIAKTMGASIEFEWMGQYPPTVNDAEASELVRRVAGELVGADHVLQSERTMGAEDMSYYLQEKPGCFFFLGCGNSELGLDKPHHNPYFDYDERVLPLGVAMFAGCAKEFFK